jgi:hypothetical protein
MAHNALVDLEQDRSRRPGRPLPRGAVPPRTIALVGGVATASALALAATVAVPVLVVAGLVVIVSLAYHAGLKRARLPGCALLGSARGLDLALGAVAYAAVVVEQASLPAAALAVVLAYALYMAGASLHASTDDEAGSGAWSRAGLGLAFIAIAALLVAAFLQWPPTGAASVAGLLVLVWAGVRLGRGATRLPAPALTGVALSNLHLLDAGVCLIVAPVALAVPAGAVVLALFWFSRRLLAVFPPT